MTNTERQLVINRVKTVLDAISEAEKQIGDLIVTDREIRRRLSLALDALSLGHQTTVNIIETVCEMTPIGTTGRAMPVLRVGLDTQ